jgi:transcriptional regulator with PAS, ATPase and Fis domain
MSPFCQAKIVRCIEIRQVYPLGAHEPLPLDLRVVAATNQDLEELIAGGNYRSDLYYRLNVARVHLPPLRDRREDIPALVAHGIRKLNLRHTRTIKHLTDEAMEILLQHDWPGNVRELMNILEASYINMPDGQIDYADLPEHFKCTMDATKGLAKDERSRIVAALLESRWNKSAAAQKLNWSRMTLYRKMQMYNIVKERRTTFC